MKVWSAHREAAVNEVHVHKVWLFIPEVGMADLIIKDSFEDQIQFYKFIGTTIYWYCSLKVNDLSNIINSNFRRF